MTVLTDKPEVDRIDAALLVEELADIYSTPTPKGWREAEKNNWYWLICMFTTCRDPLLFIGLLDFAHKNKTLSYTYKKS